MTRRLAGHLHSEKKARPVLLQQSFQKPVPPKTTRHTGTTSEKYPDYTFRNTADDYIKARVYVRNALTGERHKEPLHWTFTSRRGALTQGAMLAAVEAQLRKKAENYGNDQLEVVGISFEEEITYPARAAGIPPPPPTTP